MLFKTSTFSHTPLAQPSSRGFGLIELMVSISIMTLVSTVILVKNRSFNNALLLRNQAYEIAFSLRQVQLLAVSTNVKETGTRRNQYGAHFVTGSSTYRMFRDNGSNLNWSDSGDATLAPLGNLDSRFIVADITDSLGNSLSGNELSVTFVRPNFDGIFYTANGTRYSSGPIYIKITPRDSNGYTDVPSRVVEVTSTGQISVK
jgi:prepilin-type N-terminal cleavage/methylation domain-containing protein